MNMRKGEREGVPKGRRGKKRDQDDQNSDSVKLDVT